MAEQRLKPAEGRWVPQRDGTPWPVEGLTVETGHYERRRIDDGDLVVVPDRSTKEQEAGTLQAAPADETEEPAGRRKARNGEK